MNRSSAYLLSAGLVLGLSSAPLRAQRPHLHVNDRWENCAIVVDPSLTQQAWHQFVSEVGPVTYLRPLDSARPLGAKHVELALLQWDTRIDDAAPAWNDTFSHPDSLHWLKDGAALPIPGLMLRVGVSDRVDVGAYLTKAIGANYGMIGGQVQYNLLDDRERNLAAAARVTGVKLVGPEDLSASVYGLDFLVSKDLWVLSPYAGVSGNLSRGQVHTSKVSLHNENVFGVAGMVGVAARISVLRLGAEYNLARVSGYSIKIGFGR